VPLQTQDVRRRASAGQEVAELGAQRDRIDGVTGQLAEQLRGIPSD
jgi:hypothetical protein